MSRIGKLPISIPAGVTVAQDKDGIVTVKGPKGELSQKVDPSIKVKIEDGHITFEIDENSPVNVKQKQAFHGLYRALVNNMVVGVSEGYKKELELVGVGYRVSNQGNIIEFSLGYTHPIFIQLPQEVKVEDGHVTFEIDENSPVNIKQKQAFHGLYRALVNNMVVGVSEGYKKEMELIGVGYRVSNQGNIIEFSLGYTHPIFIQLPKEVKVETKMERNQNPQIILESCDKQLLGMICAKIRSFRMPEPYKGKGILFKGEVIRRKSGKSASAK